MAWETPKTNWQENDALTPGALNRIEGNINYIEEENRTLSDTATPVASGKLSHILNFIASMIKSITGKANWYTAPATTLEATKTHIDATNVHGATSAATANKIMMRDASGRAKVAAPAAADDIARKDTVDNHAIQTATLSTLGHVKHAVLTATLTAVSWTGTTSPYSQSVTVSGIASTDTPIIDVVMSGTYSTDEARIEAWGYIYRAVTAKGSITFYATEKPTVGLPIQIKVVR